MKTLWTSVLSSLACDSYACYVGVVCLVSDGSLSVAGVGEAPVAAGELGLGKSMSV